MTQQHPITPPPELIYEWAEDRELLRDHLPLPEYIANCAAQWGADLELDACCRVLNEHNPSAYWGELLRSRRRPEPPRLKEQALALVEQHEDGWRPSPKDWDTIRRALEQLPDHEPSGNSR